MRRRRIQAKKPKILEVKKQIAKIARRSLTPIEFSKNHSSHYWKGTYNVDGLVVQISVQRYVRRLAIDWIDIRHVESRKMLTPKEIKELLNNIKT